MTSEVETAVPSSEVEQDTGADDSPKEEESTANCEPACKLEELEVLIGEEDEDDLLSMRAKLLIHGETSLDKGTGNKSWVERGVGVIRLLKHREKGTIRVLMRQEMTMKVIANHQLDPSIAMKPSVNSDRSWVWVAYDCADGESPVHATFACRFKDSSAAKEFKDILEKYRQETTKFDERADATDSDSDSSEGDEAGAAMANLTTNDDKTDE